MMLLGIRVLSKVRKNLSWYFFYEKEKLYQKSSYKKTPEKDLPAAAFWRPKEMVPTKGGGPG